MKDLIEYDTEQPKELKTICDKWLQKMDENGLEYKECEEFKKECEEIGYTFEYGLDAEPFNLHKIIFLNSVGTMLINGISYPKSDNFKYNKEEGFKVDEIENFEWWENLSQEDFNILNKLQLINEEFLHEKARELMIKLDEKYKRDTLISLDEYLCEFYYELTEEERTEIQDLLNLF